MYVGSTETKYVNKSLLKYLTKELFTNNNMYIIGDIKMREGCEGDNHFHSYTEPQRPKKSWRRLGYPD